VIAIARRVGARIVAADRSLHHALFPVSDAQQMPQHSWDKSVRVCEFRRIRLFEFQHEYDWAVPSAACQNYPQKNRLVSGMAYRLLKSRKACPRRLKSVRDNKNKYSTAQLKPKQRRVTNSL